MFFFPNSVEIRSLQCQLAVHVYKHLHRVAGGGQLVGFQIVNRVVEDDFGGIGRTVGDDNAGLMLVLQGLFVVEINSLLGLRPGALPGNGN